MYDNHIFSISPSLHHPFCPCVCVQWSKIVAYVLYSTVYAYSTTIHSSQTRSQALLSFLSLAVTPLSISFFVCVRGEPRNKATVNPCYFQPLKCEHSLLEVFYSDTDCIPINSRSNITTEMPTPRYSPKVRWTGFSVSLVPGLSLDEWTLTCLSHEIICCLIQQLNIVHPVVHSTSLYVPGVKLVLWNTMKIAIFQTCSGSPKIYSHFVNSHLVNFPLCLFPLSQFPFGQC